MIKTGDALARLQLFPGAGIDLPANALSIEKIFGKNKAWRFQTEVFYVVIPSVKKDLEKSLMLLRPRIQIQRLGEFNFYGQQSAAFLGINGNIYNPGCIIAFLFPSRLILIEALENPPISQVLRRKVDACA